jgi:acyl-CoA thioester hydrolase
LFHQGCAQEVAELMNLFTQGVAAPAATGRFVHVWVDRATSTPVDIPATIRAALAPLVVGDSA